MDLKCNNCGKVPHVLVHGYDFGDRLLEDVWFMVEDVDGKPSVIGVTPDCEDYFSELNKDMWIDACQTYCEHLDVAMCPKCPRDIIVWGHSDITGIKPPEPKEIKMCQGVDIFEELRKRAEGL